MSKLTTQVWSYSLRWAMPHLPCPGPVVLVSIEVPAGAPCPAEIDRRWRPGTGYCVSVDFGALQPMRQWSPERKANTRRRNLAKRIAKAAPLFADELIARELARRPAYFEGANPASGMAVS